jgi:serine/threonine-protein kinase
VGAGDQGAAVGRIVDRKYKLVEIGGVGGMATVWRAVLEGPGRFRRTVAIKHMHPHLADQAMYRDMFFEEARVGAELSDPNLAQVQDFIEEDGHLYLIMEWVEGIDLATYLRYAGAISQTTRWELVTAVGIGLTRGLAAAHEHTNEDGDLMPVLHRDVSPHNVLISVKGPARLIDFGLALAADRMTPPTPPGTAKGKLAYLSPEVARGEPATPASDQFAAASVLWEALAGRKCFEGSDQAEVFRKLTTAEVTPLAKVRKDVPRRLCEIIERALEADPGARYPSARAMAVELGDVLRSTGASTDLYALLSRTVVDAREALNMGGRTQAPTIADAIADEESQIAIPLLLRSAWRKLRSRIPFLGSDEPEPELQAAPEPRAEPVLIRPPDSTSEIRRANAQGIVHLGHGNEAEVGELRLRLLPLDSERTPTDPVIQLDVTHTESTERVGLEVPGQTLHVGYLLTALSRDAEGLLLRATPARAGVAMPVFPYIPIVIGELTLEITGVGDARAFLKVTRDGQRAENLIVAVADGAPGTVEREGYRITLERLEPPWAMMRVDEIDEIETLDEGDLIEVPS